MAGLCCRFRCWCAGGQKLLQPVGAQPAEVRAEEDVDTHPEVGGELKQIGQGRVDGLARFQRLQFGPGQAQPFTN